ncbi:MAG TPA: stage V sporulation protein E [Pseudogracilibacillus sp.]|nr:stage V sporulation protein E [Pseudogracilibacillus sp.]
MNQHRLPNISIVVIVLSLLTIGVFMVYSSSYVWAEYKYGDPYYFLKRQLLFATAGIISMALVTFIPFYKIRRYVHVILLTCICLLVLVLVPGIGMVRGGAQSWIGVGAFSIQPAEFIKLSLILYLAHYLAKNKMHMNSFFRGFLFPHILIGICFGLIMLQPDLGTGIVLVLTCSLMIFVAGANFRYFIYLIFIGLIGFVLLILSAPYRISRITSFLNPWDDPLGDGFQIIQSLYAIGPGKLLGVGYGKSLQKYFYLPEPQTDFIFAIYAEELGFLGGCLLIFLFYLLYRYSLRVAYNSLDPFARYVVIGIITMITIQFMINISVVIGLIPVTGITLPFLSYGGSSLTLTLASMGILLNITMYEKNVESK